jgi:hypothetical protein
MSLHVGAFLAGLNSLADIKLRMSQLSLTIALFDREQASPTTSGEFNGYSAHAELCANRRFCALE